MTSRELLMVMLRRWPLVLVAAALTLVGAYVAAQPRPVYFTQYEVVVLPPLEPTQPNVLQDSDYGMTPLAGLLMSDVSGGEREVRMATSGTTLYGEGVTRGERVQLRNTGSQWVPVYATPTLDVQVVDTDREVVVQRAAVIAADLREALLTRQVDMRIQQASRATLQQNPVDPVIYEIRGSRPRAAGVVLLGGPGLTILLVPWLDRHLATRRRRRSSGAEAPAIERQLVG